ncbi:hypothetical protein D9613_010386 [Agrocybe pediades]|uniref:CxC6 like cysteine cluster associated with KDZ domain-containing protein n=1 Tax=Agrocybe pediades TaxID=84607 RepID=A0A8H4QFD3_9AGAR|nr:hypothetical protein D9613_010386 [Agrocybe pediades]
MHSHYIHVSAFHISLTPWRLTKLTNTAYRHIYPPTWVCLSEGCINHRPDNSFTTLSDSSTYPAALFTLREGILPVYATSLSCPECRVRYYNNYSVDLATGARTYYHGVPEIIQVAEHSYMERSLLEFFSLCMLFGWLSSLNCAKIYNTAIATRHAEVLNNPRAFPPELRASVNKQAPAEYSDFKPSSLILQDIQADRLRPALQERNRCMEGTGQEEYTHACDACFLVSVDSEGRKTKIHPAVSDGITLGHPCCSVHDCANSLLNNKFRYCEQHMYKQAECSIEGCSMPSTDDFRTCALPEHRAKEEQYFATGKSIFQLKERLKKVTADLQPSLVDELAQDEEFEPIDCSGKPETGNRQLKTSFSQRRTHNEQFIMRPCGVILSRATLFGSESVSAVYEFAKATFPTLDSTPELFIYDNSCNLDAHIKAQGHQHFCNTGFLVDVFHFRSKHRETDRHCQENCNPAMYPEIFESDKWKINTSICEQTNRWLSGYQAILRDLEGTRFNFYLDEMVKRYNRFKVRDLEAKGCHPWNIPVDMVFPSNSNTMQY